MKIVIDGIIGAGKSTQASLISDMCNIDVVKEPIDEWPLDLFYSDPSRWGFLMQTAVLTSFAKFKNLDGIFERSPESSKEIFWKNLVDSNVVSSTEDEIFHKLYNLFKWEPDVTIFIQKKPELCYKHIQARGQAGDDGVSLEYLNTLDTYYNEYVEKCSSPVHVVDGNGTIEETNKNILKILKPYIKQGDPWTHDVYM
jgi:deoxyadenosine/deoxycytidine kinase